MVDRLARNKLAEQIQALVENRLSTDDFSDSTPIVVMESKDIGVRAVWEIMDSLYSDLTSQKFKDLNLHTNDLRKVENARLFLRTDFEYLWPPFPRYQGSWFSRALWAGALPVLVLAVILGIENLFHQPLIASIGLAV